MTLAEIFQSNLAPAEDLSNSSVLKTTAELAAMISETWPVKLDKGQDLFTEVWACLDAFNYKHITEDGRIVWLVRVL